MVAPETAISEEVMKRRAVIVALSRKKDLILFCWNIERSVPTCREQAGAFLWRPGPTQVSACEWASNTALLEKTSSQSNSFDAPVYLYLHRVSLRRNVSLHECLLSLLLRPTAGTGVIICLFVAELSENVLWNRLVEEAIDNEVFF